MARGSGRTPLEDVSPVVAAVMELVVRVGFPAAVATYVLVRLDAQLGALVLAVRDLERVVTTLVR